MWGIGGNNAGVANLEASYRSSEIYKKNAMRVRGYFSDSASLYYPSYPVNLKKVGVEGEALLKKAQKLEKVKAQGVTLVECTVKDLVDAGTGAVKIERTNILGSLVSKGKVVVIKSSSIDNLTLNPSDGMLNLKIVDSTISTFEMDYDGCCLVASRIEGCFKYKSKDGKFNLYFKNVTIENIKSKDTELKAL